MECDLPYDGSLDIWKKQKGHSNEYSMNSRYSIIKKYCCNTNLKKESNIQDILSNFDKIEDVDSF